MSEPVNFYAEFQKHVDLRLRVKSLLPYAFEYKHYYDCLMAISQELKQALNRMSYVGSTNTTVPDDELTIPIGYKKARLQLERTVDSLVCSINVCDQMCCVK